MKRITPQPIAPTLPSIERPVGFLTPQCGHVSASVETSLLHSLHFFSAMITTFGLIFFVGKLTPIRRVFSATWVRAYVVALLFATPVAWAICFVRSLVSSDTMAKEHGNRDIKFHVAASINMARRWGTPFGRTFGNNQVIKSVQIYFILYSFDARRYFDSTFLQSRKIVPYFVQAFLSYVKLNFFVIFFMNVAVAYFQKPLLQMV